MTTYYIRVPGIISMLDVQVVVQYIAKLVLSCSIVVVATVFSNRCLGGGGLRHAQESVGLLFFPQKQHKQ